MENSMTTTDRFSDRARKELQQILEPACGPKHADLIGELERSLPLFRWITKHPEASELELSKQARGWIKAVRQAAVKLKDLLGKGTPEAVEGTGRLITELLMRGLSPFPSRESLKQAIGEDHGLMLDILDVSAPEVQDGNASPEQVAMFWAGVTLPVVKESEQRREEGQRHTEFLMALCQDVDQIIAVADDIPPGKAGRPREHTRYMIAVNVARMFRRHGLKPVETESTELEDAGKDTAHYWRTLEIVLLESGDQVPDSIRRYVEHGVKSTSR
jgi:hypothetical protein